jgi:enoyl-CoA hydratase
VTDHQNLLVETDGAVATITLNRPERLNALSNGLLDDLFAALAELNPGDDVRVIRIRGAGRAFCPGYDLMPGSGYQLPRASGRSGESMAELGESAIARDREALRAMVERWLWMWNYRKPIIAQAHGHCLSGGLDLIGACDIVFAAEGTLFGHPAARGMGIPVTIGTYATRIGAAATKELLFTGDLIDAAEARELGIVRRVLPPEQLDAYTLAFCQRVALNPLDLLTVHKHVTNRALELTGHRVAALVGAEFDAIAHLSPAGVEFGRRVKETGLRDALAWRDQPFSTGPLARHDAAERRTS